MQRVIFDFDIVSPYAYLAFERLPSALEGVSLELLERGATTREVSLAKRTMHQLLGHAFGDDAA